MACFVVLIFFWMHCIFIAARRLSLIVASKGYSSLQCMDFSLQLQSTGSRRASFSSCGSRALECRISSCGAQA